MTFQLTWLGTAGFMVRSASYSILIDPYFSAVAAPPITLGRSAS